MDKITKLAIPISILIGCIIIGNFIYATQQSNQSSIERQRYAELKLKEVELNAKQDADSAKVMQESAVRLKKSACVDEAIKNAQYYYKQNCYPSCKEGQYYTVSYDKAYNTCLQKNGLL